MSKHIDEIRNKDGQTIQEFLQAYNPGDYERPSVTVDVAILIPEKQILLIQRKNHPNIGRWALPGGFLNMDEELYAGALRELKEETSAENLALVPLGMFGAVGRDPRTRIITMAFASMVTRDSLRIQAGDDAQDALWFDIEIQSLGMLKIPKTKNLYPDVALPCSAYGQPLPTQANGYTILLQNQERGLCLSATIAFDDGNPILLQTPAEGRQKDGAIAGDHGLIIAAAIQKYFDFV